MVSIVVVDDIFKINKNYKIVSNTNKLLIIDDWYEYPEKIHSMLQQATVTPWKYADKSSRNCIDYYDCRLILQNYLYTSTYIDNLSIIKNLIDKYLEEVKRINLTTADYIFNYYKSIKKDIPNNLQHHPHVDFKYNCIIYLDKVSSGGTCLYEGNINSNNEHNNLLYNVDKYKKEVIQSKFNRLVIFKGDRLHGGYIEDHNKYLDNWRINQIILIQ